MTIENYTGANCSGSSGGTSRILILSNTQLTSNNSLLVFLDGLLLSNDSQCTISNKVASTTITFNLPIWDDQIIIVQYFGTEASETIYTGTTINDKLIMGLNKLFSMSGIVDTFNIINYTNVNSDYDDVVTQTLTGSILTSGLMFPMHSSQGSSEALLLQQGKILTKDKILYTGSLNTSGNLLIDIQGDKYTIIPDGITRYDSTGSTIYNKMYLRQTLAGSLF